MKSWLSLWDQGALTKGEGCLQSTSRVACFNITLSVSSGSISILWLKITMFLRERVDSGLLDQGIPLEAEIKYNASPHWYRLFWKKCPNKSLNRKRLNEIVYNLETSCTNSIFPFNQCSMVRFSSKNKDVCERDGELIESIRPGKATKRESLLPLTSS